ncbi:MAG: ribosomal-processing cysteine protease Prp, partial [Ruminococcus sp.]|nr:ribosomal-processing cysteine protease Prp [Ruminococcus sp.]
MIKVTFEAGNGVIKNVCISGHSGYAEEGSDIVCAAVSSAAIMTF